MDMHIIEKHTWTRNTGLDSLLNFFFQDERPRVRALCDANMTPSWITRLAV